MVILNILIIILAAIFVGFFIWLVIFSINSADTERENNRQYIKDLIKKLSDELDLENVFDIVEIQNILKEIRNKMLNEIFSDSEINDYWFPLGQVETKIEMKISKTDFDENTKGFYEGYFGCLFENIYSILHGSEEKWIERLNNYYGEEEEEN